MPRKIFLVSLTALLALVLFATISFAQEGNHADPASIYLKSYTFSPDDLPDLPPI